MNPIREMPFPVGTALILVLTGGTGCAGEDGSFAMTASPIVDDIAAEAIIEADDAIIEVDDATIAADSATIEADGASLELDCLRVSGPFAWNCAGPIPGMTCVQILEPSDPDTWGDNYFCSSSDFGIRWSYAGAIGGMRCVSVYEPVEPPEQAWRDNYLCAPADSHFHFLWSYAGPLAGLGCLQWNEPADPQTWGDNMLCWQYF